MTNSAKRIVAICLSAVLMVQGLVPVPSAMAETVASTAERAGQQAVSDADGFDQNGETDPNGKEASSSEEQSSESASSVESSTTDAAASTVQSTDLVGETSADAGEAADTEEAATARNVSAPATADELKEAIEGNNGGTVTLSGDTVATVSVSSRIGLKILSNADPALYQTADISLTGITGTESLDLCSEEKGYSFQGLGSANVPFEGSLSLPEGMWLQIDRTLFNGVTLNSKSSPVNIRWAGAPTYNEPIVAAGIDGNGQTLSARVQLANPFDASITVAASTAAVSSALLGTTTGNLTVQAEYSFASNATRKGFAVASSTANAGLIANTVASGKLKVESVGLPSSDIEGTPTVAATANAGGLVGAVCVDDAGKDTTETAEVEIAAGVDVSAFAIKGADASGGLIGKANGLSLTLPSGEDGADAIKPALNVGDAVNSLSEDDIKNSMGCLYAGGVIGYVAFAKEQKVDASAFDFGEGVSLNAVKKADVERNPRAGGLFGALDVTKGDITVKGGACKSKLVSGADDDNNNRGSYGGLVGIVFGTEVADGSRNALVVGEGGSSTATEIDLGDNGKFRYVGGIAGYVGNKKDVALVLCNASVSCKTGGPSHSQNCKFGGAVGVLGDYNVLEVRGLKVETSDGVAIGGGSGGFAGIAGSSWLGIIKFSGVTDLSGAKFLENDKTAQLVWQNYNSLIFADGSGSDQDATIGSADKWKYVRPNHPVQLDDLYDYGQVVRLGGSLSSDFITINDKHQWEIKGGKLAKTSGEFQIANAEAFAKLAISWQTSGFFPCAEGVSDRSIAAITSSTIKLMDDIDLSGTGITGFTKDRLPTISELSEQAHAFQGTFEGNSKKITLAVGEAYGWRGGDAIDAADSSAGNGMVYRHDLLGLFMGLGNATVTGLTVDGSMRFDGKAGVNAGPLAAKSSGTVGITESTFEPIVDYDNTGDGKVARVGGIIGTITGGNVAFGKNTNVHADIASDNEESGNSCVGGAVGMVASNAAATITASGLSIDGKISYNDGTDSKRYAGVGGFIGVIREKDAYNGNSAESKVSITKLSLDNLAIENNVKKGSGTVGGLLGYSWGKAVVDFGDASNNEGNYALTANGASVSAPNATEFGGLVYAASGKWTINDYAIDLSSATFNAPNADWFGMLVCSAGRNYTQGNGSFFDWLSGLYLLNTASWETAYKVNTGDGAVNAKSLANFDEWVADSRGVNWSSKSLITGIGVDGVVSLHTAEASLHMDEGEQRNSYENRTAFGKDHPTNGYCRYYYNLDRAFEVVQTKAKHDSNSWMETPEELLLWSAATYAAPGIRDYIVKTSGTDGYPYMTGSARISGNIDLTGYSYYPVDATNISVYVRNASITFAYEKIDAKETGNKKNSKQTQHMNMHAGLFRQFTAPYASNMTMSVENTTLSGTIGMNIDDDGKTITSGALVCKNANGSSTNGGKAIININSLTLGGLRVANANQSYAPLLVADMTTFADLNVKDLKITEGSYKNDSGDWLTAGTSLFGNLGGSNADMVSATFNRVSVPSSKNSSIFTHASLLESFGYGDGKTGTASYTFVKQDQTEGMVTFGKEIDFNGEYHGRQYWYYDEKGYGTDANLVNDLNGHVADKGTPQFGDYLPYVCKDKDGTSFHEIKVNQRIPSLKTGCGTYGDPYAIKNAEELYAVTNFIRSGNAAAMEGWEVTIAKNQQTLCARRSSDGSTDNEVTYVYSTSNGWVNVADQNDKLEGDTMLRYLQSAYYSIEPSGDENEIVLDGDSFQGFGNATNPFRGVIVGNLNKDSEGNFVQAKLVLQKKSNTFLGLIPYSYGSVVKGLTVEYDGSAAIQKLNSVSYAGKSSSNNGVPEAFFGGVIGCIMGGDNIIDGVTVSNTGDFSVAGAAPSAHLVPIGGYVGTIAGGGVIFRGMGSNSISWHSAGRSLYDNPYVGRVIDGYAFSENCVVDNTNRNYKINVLNTEDVGCVTTTDTYLNYIPQITKVNKNTASKVSINDEQGLLVLSAIINSGAAAGAASSNYVNCGPFRGSRAYEGRSYTDDDLQKKRYLFGNEQYGKVRNAAYDQIGRLTDANDAEWGLSKSDDMKAPGNQIWQGPLNSTDENNINGQINSPYLVRKYANWATGYICATGMAGIDIQLAKQQTSDIDFDMEKYGSGYLGLSGRYYSNACYANYSSTERRYITPAIACINGNGASIKAALHVKEYSDDDYKASGVGALFGNVMYTSSYVANNIQANDGCTVKDLTFVDCNISLDYFDENGKEITGKPTSDNVQVGVGCLAGVTSNMNSQEDYGVYKNVHIQSCVVSGGANAGGLLGSAGYMRMRDNADITRMTVVDWNGWRNRHAPVKLVDSSYSDCTVTGQSNAGGFVGKIHKSNCEIDNSAKAEVASSSTIRGTVGGTGNEACTVGGVVGLTGGQVIVGAKTDASSSIIVKDVTVTTDAADGETGYGVRGIGGIAGYVENNSISVAHVKIKSDELDGEARAYIGSKNLEYSNSYRYRYVGGIFGYGTSGADFNDCTIAGIRIAAREDGGGLGGWLNSGTFSADGISVDMVQIDGTYSGGLLGGCASGVNTQASNVCVQNSVFKKNTVTGWKHPDGNNTYSGCIIGDTKGTIAASNILLNENEFEDPSHQGLLFGDVDSGDIKGISVAGVAVRLKAGETNADVPLMMHYRYGNDKDNDNKKGVNKKSYIAFADYNDDLDAIDGSTLYSDDDNADGSMASVTSVSPYVSTNPKNVLSVKDTSGGESKCLFGDGATIDAANTIKSEAGSPQPGRYTYTNIGGITGEGVYDNTNSYEASVAASTYNTNNTSSSGAAGKFPQVASDFPVLLISGNDTTTVTNYLDLVTNGGFSDAVRLNTDSRSPHVTAKAEMFELAEDGTFVHASDKTASLSVVGNGTTAMGFHASTSWDNEQHRFTLLTVTFSEAGQKYKVQVPIIVKRMLEIEFTATYAYGTKFNPDEYGQLGDDSHVLSSSGESMAGYLTWAYNRANGTTTEYGWDTHLASGGSMGPLNKSILFDGKSGTLPAGTQLTLVDTANNDKEYYYTVPDGGAKSVKLTDFVAANGGQSYEEPWFSQTMGVTATKDDNGIWVECKKDEDPGAKVGTGDDAAFYRVATEVDTGQRYTLNVATEVDVENKVKEISPTENFYLVITVPAGTQAAVNGYTYSSIAANVNSRVNPMLRPGGVDSHFNTASTYSIYTNYGQSLSDNVSGTYVKMSDRKDASGVGYTLPLDVTDTVVFNKNQQYNLNDKLYFQLSSSLGQYGRSGSLTSAGGWPTGVSGTATFYVKIGDSYYTWKDSEWINAGTAEQAAGSVPWSSDGGEMKLRLPYDLSGIRSAAKEAASGSEAKFTVQVKISPIQMSEMACMSGIAAGQLDQQQIPSAYTKMRFQSSLAVSESALDASSTTANIPGQVGYYREDNGDSTIELSASMQSQLGINVSDLALANGTIAAYGTYDLSDLINADDLIGEATSVRYTLKLQKRMGTDGSYSYVPIGNQFDMMESPLGTVEQDGNQLVFVDSKAGNAFITRKSDKVFQFPFVIKVNTDVEDNNFTYANYRLVLSAELLNANGRVINTPVNKALNSGYQNSDYITYTLSKINTSGISH